MLASSHQQLVLEYGEPPPPVNTDRLRPHSLEVGASNGFLVNIADDDVPATISSNNNHGR